MVKASNIIMDHGIQFMSNLIKLSLVIRVMSVMSSICMGLPLNPT